MARKNILIGFIGVAASLLLGFIIAAQNGSLESVNTAVYGKLLLTASSPWFLPMLIATNVGSFSTVVLILLLVSVALVLRRNIAEAIAWFLGIGAAEIAGELFKYFFHIKRPLGGLVPETGFSYPSGHTTGMFVLATLLLLLFIPRIKNKATRFLSAVLAIGVAFLVAYSRLALGVHSLTDIVGGITLGAGTALIAVGAYQSIKPRSSYPRSRATGSSAVRVKSVR